MVEQKHIKKLVIVGGGTAGWMAAAVLSRQLKPELYDISVVDSSHISGIGVGESVVPAVVSFLAGHDFDMADFIQKTEACYKLGTRFEDWHGDGESYFHPFGTLGRNLNGYGFFDCWLKARSGGDQTPLTDYSPAAVMAANHSFDPAQSLKPGSPLSGADYALHLDAGLAQQYFRQHAEQRGVKRINAHIVHIKKHQDGQILSLELNNRHTVEGDFFIDCSGFRGLLIDEALNSPLQSWKHLLHCDRAIAVQETSVLEPPLYTTATANEFGWTWKIPLQKRISHGYVFSSEYCTDEQAKQTLLKNVDGQTLQEPWIIPFQTGIREQFWSENCMALGLAGGFLEPLESTAIYLVTRGIQHLLELFPDFSEERKSWPSLSAEYNARMRADFEEIRDLIILHYCATKRSDTEFWRRCQSSPVPDSLAERIELFSARGELRITRDGLFRASEWQSVLVGMGIEPRSWHPFLDMSDFEVIHGMMQADRDDLDQVVRNLSTNYGTHEK